MTAIINRWIRIIFFGNYFYGICAIALSVEAALQQQAPLQTFSYYTILFCVTVVYYSWAYINDRSGYPSNERTIWYQQHQQLLWYSLVVLGIIALGLILQTILRYWAGIMGMRWFEFFLLLVFPLSALFYYGIGASINIRRFGWMKPFFIGFAWAGIVTWYPVILYCIEHQTAFQLNTINELLFLKNFMFISVLCILFDIKDYAVDANRNLQTFIVRSGLRNTIFFIVIPLCLIGLGIYIFYAITHSFPLVRIGVNILPFILLMLASYSLKKRKSLLYYLICIDGLMLVKGVCGSLAML